jgi:hypothetical protein
MMKKIILVCAAVLTTFVAKADEGMWTLYNLPQAIYNQMQAEGFTMPYENLYSANHAIKNAVVNFGGFCSGVVVSPDGLVFTNHHCGFEAIRSHSSVEHDYMLNGFYAKDYADELPNEGLFVSFMVKQEDYTAEMERLGINSKKRSELEHFVDSIENVLQKDVHAKDSTLHIELKPFYEGNKYYLTTYRDFKDVRLVFAVPKSMGKFGGETDNWMWPRQTCDFSVFRIYANPKTNGPAEYAKENVPYHPADWAAVSMQGYKEGDFSMTVGYPGSTSRYLSSYGIQQRRDAVNTPTIQVRELRQEIMLRHMRADEAVRIKYDSKFAQSSNYWKNFIGMNKCIDSIGLIKQKQEYEAQLRHWQDSTGYLKGKLDFDKLAQLYAKRFDAMRAIIYGAESFYRGDEMSRRAIAVHSGIEVKGPKENKKKQYVEFADNTKDWDQATDRELLAASLKNYREHVDKKYQPSIYQLIDTKFNGNERSYVDYLYDHSKLMQNGQKIYINKKSFNKDCGTEYGLSLICVKADIQAEIDSITDAIRDQEQYLCAARLRMEQDMPNYSDANFTMRLSYGQVGGFNLGGKPSGYYTTAQSIVDKMNQGNKVIEYQAEPIMKDLLSAKDFGPYTDKTTGKMQLCFLTNNDITGGNSGSPMFNGKGELIGLAFDGNWDSLAGGIFFDRKLARCIGVDIRYVLYMMDKWGHTDRLLKEINAK